MDRIELKFLLWEQTYNRFLNVLKTLEFPESIEEYRRLMLSSIVEQWIADQEEKIKQKENNLSIISPFESVKVGDHVTIQDRSICYGNNTYSEFKEQVLNVTKDNIYTESEYIFSKSDGKIAGRIHSVGIPGAIADYILIDPNPPGIDPSMPLSFGAIWKHIQRLDKRIDSLTAAKTISSIPEAVVDSPEIISYCPTVGLNEELMNRIALLKEKIHEVKPGDRVYVLEDLNHIAVEKEVIAVSENIIEIANSVVFDKKTLMVPPCQQKLAELFGGQKITNWKIIGLKLQK